MNLKASWNLDSNVIASTICKTTDELLTIDKRIQNLYIILTNLDVLFCKKNENHIEEFKYGAKTKMEREIN